MPNAKFEKKAVFELLADGIEAQIRQEGWKGLLPSGRDLANQHKVSLPTVQKAIALLIERQVLVSRGSKRRLEVAARVSGSQGPTGRHDVLVLATKPLGFMMEQWRWASRSLARI
jgi:DNA-binding transcriptional MocR family regulator